MNNAAHTLKCNQIHHERRKGHTNKYEQQHFALFILIGNITAIKRQAHRRYGFAQTYPGKRHFTMSKLINVKPEHGGLHLVGERKKKALAKIDAKILISQGRK